MSAAAPHRPHPWLLVACASLSLFLVMVDFSVNVSLPAITADLGTTLLGVQWVMVGFLAVRIGLLLGLGGAVDAFGLRRLLVMGALGYTVAALLIGVAPTLTYVVALRVFQGIGAAALVAVAPALASRAFLPGHRGPGLGVAVGGIALGMVAGTLGGGFLVEAVGWRAIFLARVPIGFALIGLTLVVLRHPEQRHHRMAYDWMGATTAFLSLVLLVPAVGLSSRGWTTREVLVPLVLSPLFLGIFIYLELRSSWPVLDLRALGRRGFTTGFLNILLAYLAVFVIMYVFPFYMVDIRGASSLGLGIALAIMGLLSTVAAPPSGLLSDRVGSSYVATLGMVVLALGLLWIGKLDVASSLAAIGLRVAVAGLGLGIVQAGSYNLALNAMPAERSGITSAVLGLGQALGSVFGIAMSGAFFTSRYGAYSVAPGADGLQPGPFVPAFQETMLLSAGVAALAAGVSLLGWTRERRGRGRGEQATVLP